MTALDFRTETVPEADVTTAKLEVEGELAIAHRVVVFGRHAEKRRAFEQHFSTLLDPKGKRYPEAPRLNVAAFQFTQDVELGFFNLDPCNNSVKPTLPKGVIVLPTAMWSYDEITAEHARANMPIKQIAELCNMYNVPLVELSPASDTYSQTRADQETALSPIAAVLAIKQCIPGTTPKA